jgi:hypothetical protein
MRSFFVASLLVAATIVTVSAPPARADVPSTTPSADELFALARKAAIARIAHLPPYVSYKLDAQFARKGKTTVSHYLFVVRTSDGKEFAQPLKDSPADRVDTTPSVEDGAKIFSPFTVFDLRPRAPGERVSQFEAQSSPSPEPAATGTTVIGHVASVTHVYDVTLVGREQLNGVDVWHLHTHANFDERHHPIVDVYMRVTDDEPIRIAIHLDAGVGPIGTHPTIVFDYRDFDGTWMASAVSTDITMRMLFFSFGGSFSGKLFDVTFPQSEPPWMFDAKLLAEHTKAERTAPKS